MIVGAVDSRLRGNDVIVGVVDSRLRGNDMIVGAVDSRLRGNDRWAAHALWSSQQNAGSSSFTGP